MGKSSREQVIATYRKRAGHYDLTANLYYLLGFREWAYRRSAIEGLCLQRGATVVEVGCGTGLNFPLLQQGVGPGGRIIGVDATDAMLDRARCRIQRAGWTNVELVNCDALEYEFPVGVEAILSTFALSLVPECGEVVAKGSEALAVGGRFVVLDLKLPDAPLPGWLIGALLPIVRPFAVTQDIVARRPWEAIRSTMEECLGDHTWVERFFGVAFLSAGTQTGRPG